MFIAAPASGQGKTTFTAALARYHRNRGRTVRVFKTGPDFLDPMILERASGHPVYQLDLWLVGESECKRLLFEAAREADLILVEGMMGLFDGTPSSADLAELFGIPVLAVIDARAMAQSFGAIAHGLASYRPSLPFAGVIANRIASGGHGAMVAESLPDGVHYFGGILREEAMELPERHLGLVQAQELADLEQRLEAGAAAIEKAGITALPEAGAFTAPETAPVTRELEGVRIAIARDAAFAFLYPANIDLLREMGATLRFFSPLADERLPECDALWLPGGYPELHLVALAENRAMKQALRAHHQAGKPMLAECGGMLYLLEALEDKEGRRGEMVGLLPGQASMQSRLAGLGMQSAPLPEGELTAHTFHHSSMQTDCTPLAHGKCRRGGAAGEPIYRQRRLTASYVHLYFASNPEATAELFRP